MVKEAETPGSQAQFTLHINSTKPSPNPTPNMPRIVRVGAVQAEPAWLDLEAGVEKTIQIIKEAAADGVQVLGFPEIWIPGYPWQQWTLPPIMQPAWVPRYIANSMARDSPQMKRIQQAAKEADMMVVLGYSERVGNSVYISQAFISPKGELLHNRQKIKPTNVERTIWGDGQADSLKCVVETPFGNVGALNCWEHFQPLLRYYESMQGAEIHVASWPAVFESPKKGEAGAPYQFAVNANYAANGFVAQEGAMFVLAATQVLTEKNLAMNLLEGNPITRCPQGGFSQVWGPNGEPMGEPLDPGAEGIVKVDVDLDDIYVAKHFLDTTGHYSRPDLLGLLVNPCKGEQVTFMHQKHQC